MASAKGLLQSAFKGWFLPAGLIFAAQAGALHMLSVAELDLPTPPLTQLPAQIGQWKLSSEEALDPAVLEYLKPDSYVLRDYSNVADNGSLNLFVAYFKSLQNSYGPHSPKVCLPGSGWLVRSSGIRAVTVPGHPEGIPVNEYVMEKNSDHILVLYWYQNNRHIWADEFKAKLTLLPDLIRYRRSDVSLVRLVAPLRDDDPTRELADSQEFTRLIFPSLVDDFGKAE
jgi:EpsI family protein